MFNFSLKLAAVASLFSLAASTVSAQESDPKDTVEGVVTAIADQINEYYEVHIEPYSAWQPLECTAKHDESTNTTRGVCIVGGDVRAPNSSTIFGLTVVLSPERNSKSRRNIFVGVDIITGEDYEPTDTPVETSLETFIVDGGGEDHVIGQVEARFGVSFNDGLDFDSLSCIAFRDAKALGACMVNARDANGVTRTVSVMVSERDNGPSIVVNTLLMEQK